MMVGGDGGVGAVPLGLRGQRKDEEAAEEAADRRESRSSSSGRNASWAVAKRGGSPPGAWG